MTKKMSVITALVIIPIVIALIAGFKPLAIGEYGMNGLKQVAPTGILLMFAVLYFATMLDAGLFDPVITWIIKTVKGDPLKVVMGTAILTMIVHLDGDGTATFMIVLSAFLPIYKKLNVSRLTLACIIALSVGPIHLVPWSGTSARAITVMKSDALNIFNPNVPAIIAGVIWVLMVSYSLGMKERKRIGIVVFENDLTPHFNEEQQKWRRPNLLVFNALLTILLIFSLMKAFLPASVLFLIASMIALTINYPKLLDQQKILKSHGINIFMVSSMIFAAGIFSGILSGTKMIDSMALSLVNLIPQEYGRFLPVITAITSFPASILFPPDAYYFGVLPILSQSANQLGIDSLEVGRAALLGQMTVGFPISPLTASTFLLIGMCEVDLVDHQKKTFWWAWGTTIVMTLMALLTGSIHL